MCNRLAYPVWMLGDIVQTHAGTGELFVMYDIACSLDKHLQVCSMLEICIYSYSPF